MYKTITDPYTRITYPINSKKGNNVLKNYLNYSMKGGAAGGGRMNRMSVLKQLKKLSPEKLKSVKAGDYDVPEHTIVRHKKTIEKNDKKYKTKFIESTKLTEDEHKRYNVLRKIPVGSMNAADEDELDKLLNINHASRQYNKWAQWKKDRSKFYPNDECCKESDDATKGIDTLGKKTVAAPAAESVAVPEAEPVAEPLADNISTKSPSPTVDNDGSCWQISVDPNTGRSYWWNTKTKETKWYNPSNNSDVPPVNLDEEWECVCNTENCNCTNASKEIPKECVTIFKKYTTALGKLKVEKSKTKSIEQLVINLSNKISTLKK